MKKKIKTKKYVTLDNVDNGENYRQISEIMTKIGYPMNHSSVRNYVMRVMTKFAIAYTQKIEGASGLNTQDIAKNPLFQDAISEILWMVESDSKLPKKNQILKI